MAATNTQQDILDLKRAMKVVSAISIIVGLIILAIYLPYQHYECKQPIDADIFGSFGDLISGVIGSIIGFFSAYLLIRTFQNQALVNENVVETNNSVVATNNSVVSTNQDIVATNQSIIAANNNAMAASQAQYQQTQLQIFDSKFRSFLDVYHKSVDSYTYEGKSGREAFEHIAKVLIEGDFINGNDYKRRSESAVEEYLEFYSKNKTYLSVHYRTLYLLVSLISESDLEVEDKVMYAKLIRGQLSDAEMYLLRYNCKSPIGRKMQPYCNEFNLTKHCSIIKLLEFKQYYNMLQDNLDPNKVTIKEIEGGLDSLFVILKKKIAKMFNPDGSTNDSYEEYIRYKFNLKTDEERKTFILSITKDKKANRRGGGARVAAAEKAFDLLKETDLRDMIRDFLSEYFFYSNFGLYNGVPDSINFEHESNNADTYKCDITIKQDKRIAVTQIQKDDRDKVESETVEIE